MAYSRDNVKKVRDEYAVTRAEAISSAKERTAMLHMQIPELAEIDRALSATGLKIMEAATGGSAGLADRIAALKEENKQLRQIRAELLESCGYPADYSDVKYRCEKCHDTGYIGTSMCPCMRRALVEAGYESSGIGTLLSRQFFENFSLDYYTDREMADLVYHAIRTYAETFTENSGNVLLIGGTGLGKTHLSTAVARTVIERGYDVLYNTAQDAIAAFEAGHFGGEGDEATEKYYTCDLLILDDLGTEMNNQFTVSSIYNLINTRIMRRKPILINSNLTAEELRRRYADRITSRLFGEFRIYRLAGQDIRSRKL